MTTKMFNVGTLIFAKRTLIKIKFSFFYDFKIAFYLQKSYYCNIENAPTSILHSLTYTHSLTHLNPLTISQIVTFS